MGLFLSTFRLFSIMEERANIALKLDKLHEALIDLQKYTALFADGDVSLEDLWNVPSSYFPNLVNFANYSIFSSKAGAMQKFGMATSQMNSMGFLSNFKDEMSRSNFLKIMFGNFFKQESDKCAKIEMAAMHEKETKIQKEIRILEKRDKMLESLEQKSESDSQKEAQHIFSA